MKPFPGMALQRTVVHKSPKGKMSENDHGGKSWVGARGLVEGKGPLG